MFYSQKADKNEVIQYLAFPRTFSLMEMTILCLNQNNQNVMWEGIWAQSNFQVFWLMWIHEDQSSLMKTKNNHSLVVFPRSLCIHKCFLCFCSKTKALRAFNVYMRTYCWSKHPVVVETTTFIAQVINSQPIIYDEWGVDIAFPVCSVLSGSNTAQAPTLPFCFTDFRGPWSKPLENVQISLVTHFY